MRKLVYHIVFVIVFLLFTLYFLPDKAFASLPSSGLLHYWKMNEENGQTIYDSSQTVNITAESTTITDGKFGKARSFNGVSDFLSFSDNTLPSGNSPLTISAWIKTTKSYAPNTYGMIFSYGTTNIGQAFTFGVGNDANITPNSCYAGPWGDALSSDISVNDSWHHCVATYDGINTYKIYLDGVLRKTKVSSITTDIVNNGTARIGSGSNSYFWDGLISNLAIYSRTLSENEVSDIYNSVTNNIKPLYTTKTGQTLTITPNCLSGNANNTFSYASSDNLNWNNSTKSWSYTPQFWDGGTIKNISFSCTSNLTGQTESFNTKVVIFRNFSHLTKYTGNPVTPANTTNWNVAGQDTLYLRPQTQINGLYYALSNSTATTEGRWDKLTAFTSPDLLNWTPLAENPAIDRTLGSWDEVYLLHPAVIKIGNLWYAYYSAYGYGAAGKWNNNPGDPILGIERIGFATSTDFIHWQKNSAPVLGNETSYAALPSVIKTSTGYRMYYYDRLNNRAKYAVSTDGLNWTDMGNYLQNNNGDWDALYSLIGFDPSVSVNQKGFYELTYSVLYNTSDFPENWAQDFGYAVSEDGINWYKNQGPILRGSRQNGDFDEWYVGNPILYHTNNRIYLYYAGAKHDPQTSNGLGQGGVAYLEADYPLYNIADLNSDNKVDIFDYNILVSNFGNTGSVGFHVADLNPDGKIDIFDYNILVSNFGAVQ